MQTFVIKNDRSDIPLAEFKTDGNKVVYTVDNTNGRIQQSLGTDYKILTQKIQQSTHLTLKAAEGPTASLLRYVLNNNDVVEITVDGKIALLNGEILSEEEKNALFFAIKAGHLHVQKKADFDSPILTKPAMQPTPKPDFPVNKKLIKAMEDDLKKQYAREQHMTKEYDSEIEELDLNDDEDPAFTKRALYILKHGG